VKSDVTMEALATSPGGEKKFGERDSEDENLVLPLQLDMINEVESPTVLSAIRPHITYTPSYHLHPAR
jgi:hypothetical protein